MEIVPSNDRLSIFYLHSLLDIFRKLVKYISYFFINCEGVTPHCEVKLYRMLERLGDYYNL